MKTLGLDIGTTSISAVIYDSERGIVEASSAKNDSFLPGKSWERIQDPNFLIGSGNGLRKNRHLCKIFEEVFGCRLILSDNYEEAACGAAIYAMKHAA